MYSRVYVEITNVCNKNCSFCHGTKRPPKRLSFDEFNKITDSLLGMTEYLYFHILGEPTMHPLLPDFIKCAAQKGFKTAITTNGTLLKSKGEELINSGVYKVNISVHSFEEGSEQEQKEYLDNIINFADKSSNAGVLTVLRLWNKGFDGGENKNIENYFRKSLSGEWHAGSRGVRIRNKLHLEYGDRFDWPDINAKEYSENVFCYGLKDHFGILSDGSVIPCCLDSEGVISLGNIFETPIKDILNTDRAKAIREGFKNRRAAENLCRRCGYATRFNR
ncbi:MAG: SPASM domain-containing protein [Clostridia bacterium]|nr:SPASM domain-containing protein [Clostridia bacterium]